MAHWIGVHGIDNGGIHMAARRAAAAGAEALQIFTAPPRFYGDKSTIRPERAERFRATLKEVGIPEARVLVHAAYVLNVATSDDEKWGRAAGGLRKELERSTAIGAYGLCFHPGSSPGDRGAAAQRVAQAITEALGAVAGETRILIENTAGAGSTYGRTPEEIGAVLEQIPAELRARTGYGLDTCHLFSAGHDISQSAERLRDVLDAFQAAAGSAPAFFHLNDSEAPAGSNRDRHALIGEGEIGVEPFRWLLADPRSRGVPLILETPQENPEIDGEDPSADPYDRRMVELLRGLV